MRNPAVIGAALCLVATRAAAQCAMCGKNAEYAGAGGGVNPLLVAALVLLVPVLLLAGGFGWLLWRFRGDAGPLQSPLDQPAGR